MKIKSNFVLRQVAEAWIAMPVGKGYENIEGVLSLNESGVLLWHYLEQECEIDKLIQILVDEYGISITQASEDAVTFIDKLRKFECLE